MEFDYIELVNILADNDRNDAINLLDEITQNILNSFVNKDIYYDTEKVYDGVRTHCLPKQVVISSHKFFKKRDFTNNEQIAFDDYVDDFFQFYQLITDPKAKAKKLVDLLQQATNITRVDKIYCSNLIERGKQIEDTLFFPKIVLLAFSKQKEPSRKLNKVVSMSNVQDQIYVEKLIEMYNEQDYTINSKKDLVLFPTFHTEFLEQCTMFLDFELKKKNLDKLDETISIKYIDYVHLMLENFWDYITDEDDDGRYIDGYDRFKHVIYCLNNVMIQHNKKFQLSDSKGACHFLINEKIFPGWILE